MSTNEQAQQSNREAFEKLVTKMGGMTNYQLFLAGVEHAEQAMFSRLEAVPVPDPDGKLAHEAREYELPWVSSEDAYGEEAVMNYRLAMLAAVDSK